MPDQSTLTVSYKVRSYEADSEGFCTLYSLCNYLQETAGDHARQLNFDIGDLSKENKTWVLQRLVIDIQTLPKWRDEISITTWPSGTDGLRAYRDFSIESSDGTRIGSALSYWMIIDLDSRRPVRVPKSLIEHRAIRDEHVLPVNRDRLSVTLSNSDPQDQYSIRPSDIDVNQHVNNAVYIRLLEDLLIRDRNVNIHDLNQVDVSFLHEAYVDEKIDLWANRSNNEIQALIKNQKKQELLKAKFLLQ